MTDNNIFDMRTTPWQGLGTKIHSPLDSREAIKQAGLDWEVAQSPVYFHQHSDFDPTLAEGHFVNYRRDTGEVLGVVGSKYQVIQNHEAFEFADSLTDIGDIKFVQGGPFGNGKKVWLLSQMPSKYVLGDRTDLYLCFVHGHDGNTGVKVFICADRFTCHNAIHANLQSAVRSWSTSHTGNVHNRLNHARMALSTVDNYMDALSNRAEKLYRVKLDKDKVNSLIHKLMPVSEDASDLAVKNTITRHHDLSFRFYNSPDLENFRYTGWGFVAAVSDYVTHAAPVRATKNFKENRFSNVISSRTLIDKAVELLAA